jgi:hypothetical protein
MDCAWDPMRRLGRRSHPHLVQVRLAEQHEAGGTHPLDEERVVVGEIACGLHPGDALTRRVTLRDEREILQQIGDAPEGTARRRLRLGARLLEERDDDRVQLRVEPFDPIDRKLDQLAR